MSRELSRLQSRQSMEETEEREKKGMKHWKEQEASMQDKGKKPFFLRKCKLNLIPSMVYADVDLCLVAEEKRIIEDKRTLELQRNKRKLRKATDKRNHLIEKKAARTAPPLRHLLAQPDL